MNAQDFVCPDRFSIKSSNFGPKDGWKEIDPSPSPDEDVEGCPWVIEEDE